MEKIIDFLLNNTQSTVLKIVNILLWVSLIIISFDKLINKIELTAFSSFENFETYFFSGGYVILFAWIICVIAFYIVSKYLLTSFLPKSKIGINYFIKYFVPIEYKVSVINMYYRRTKDIKQKYLDKAKEFWDDNNEEKIKEQETILRFLIGIVYKFIIILFLTISNSIGIQFWVLLLSVFISISFLFFLLNSITSKISMKMLHKIIGEVEF